MTGLALALVGGLGVYYLYTSVVFGWCTISIGPKVNAGRSRSRAQLRSWLIQAGLEDTRLDQFALAMLILGVFGMACGYVLFGGLIPPLVLGCFTAAAPPATYRRQRRARKAAAHDAWPTMIEEIRVLTGAAGRSVPTALFDVGRRAPEQMRSAFDAAHREWLLTTDFDLTIEVLKTRLADATADTTCETLLIAHQLGGTDLERRLTALAEDRITDTQGRKDAVARQAGARFARWFTIVVPIGMALVGMSIGDGRSAYQTNYGQALVVVALGVMIGCWTWATEIMRLPEEQRVFPERKAP